MTVEKQVAGALYITLQMKVGCEKWQNLMVSGNR